MRQKTLFFILQACITLILSIALVSAQASCDVDVADVIEQVQGVCNSIDDNQVCYGNFEVNAVAQDNAPLQNFTEQGDLADVAFLRSLYLSGLNPDTDTWGIAQMRLVTPASTGNQDINLLLFGDVEVENKVENTVKFDVLVGQYAANIRNSPRSNAVILASIPSGDTIEALGRLEDSSWIRVTLDDGSIGWVSTSLVSPADENDRFEDLPVQDNSSPYFGAMQAFYFTDNGDSQCGGVNSNGLLIQTPEGSARVTLLINEVSIELIPGANGSTTLISGNALDGMTVSVLDGEAVVESQGSSFYVSAGVETSIALNADGSAASAPSLPATYDVDAMSGLPLLGVVRDNTVPIGLPLDGSTANTGGGGNGGNGNGQGNGRGNGNGQGNGNANGRGGGNPNN